MKENMRVPFGKLRGTFLLGDLHWMEEDEK